MVNSKGTHLHNIKILCQEIIAGACMRQSSGWMRQRYFKTGISVQWIKTYNQRL